MESFSERLREKRRAAGKSQAEMASAIGMARTGYAEIEHGIAVKTFMKLPAIAKELNCRIDDLFPEMDGHEPDDKTVRADGFADDGDGFDGWEL